MAAVEQAVHHVPRRSKAELAEVGVNETSLEQPHLRKLATAGRRVELSLLRNSPTFGEVSFAKQVSERFQVNANVKASVREQGSDPPLAPPAKGVANSFADSGRGVAVEVPPPS
jgi:hypothetical protein